MLLNISSFLKENKAIVMIVSMIILFLALVSMLIIYFIKQSKIKNRKDLIRHMTTIAIFSTISIILYLTLKFNLPIFPSFLKVNFSNLPILLGGFLLGPVEGLMIIIIRTIVVLPFSGTFFVGEMADLIISSAIMLVSSIIYIRNKTRKGAILALILSIITWIVVGCLANYFILVPAYVTLFFGGNVDAFLPLLSIIPNVNENNYVIRYVLLGALPFNLMLSLVVCIITYFVYKRLSKLFHMFDDKIYEKSDIEKE